MATYILSPFYFTNVQKYVCPFETRNFANFIHTYIKVDYAINY